MTTLSSVAGALGRGSFNVVVNAVTAYSVDVVTWYNPMSNREVAIIVAIDTALRIGITHVLVALKIPFLEKGTAGHLLFPCLTLLTQPLSVKIAQRFITIDPFWSAKERYVRLFGYIALCWKANTMIKDLMYLTGLKKA